MPSVCQLAFYLVKLGKLGSKGRVFPILTFPDTKNAKNSVNASLIRQK